MKRTLLLILGMAAATAAHAQTYTHLENVMTPWDAFNEESSIWEVQRPGQALHLTGTFSLPQYVWGSSNSGVPWVSPFDVLTTGSRTHDVPYDVSGTGSTAGQHYWARLDTTIQSGHDTWQVVTSTGTSNETRYISWEKENGTPYMVITN